MTIASTIYRTTWLSQATQVFHRWWLSTLRQAWGPVLSLVQPAIWIGLFGQVFRALGDFPAIGSQGYVTYLVPGILMMTVLYSGAWAGSGYIDDMKSGVMNQYLTSPIARSAIIAGQLAQQLVTSIAQSVIVVAIGLAAGARYPGGLPGVILAVVVAAVLASVFCCLSTALALTTRNQVALIGLSQLIVLPATFLSTTMMPPALMPAWVANVSRWNPMSWAVELGRGALDGASPPGALAQAAGLAAAAVIAFAWAIRCLHRYQRSI